MRILVTGGAGYVGSVLVPMLLSRDYKVVLLDNFLWGIKPILHFAAHPHLEVVSGDIRNKPLIRELVEPADAVLHLAATVGYPACAADPDRAISTNVDGTRNVVEAIKDQKLVFASTGSTYGKVDGLCTEDTPIDPLTLYGKTKWEGEKLVTERGGIGLRFATVFGISPRLRLDLLVNDFVYQALHNRQIVLYEGHFRRTFMHVLDAARAYLFALDHYEKMRGRAFNVGNNAMNYTKREIAKMIQQHVEFYLHEADVGADRDQRDYEVSYDRIQKLGYATALTMADGLREAIRVLKHVKIVSEWRNV